MKKWSISLAVTILFLLSSGLISAININGRVLCGKSPLTGVSVTDGYSIVKTDKKGAYTINVHENSKFVYISTPSGYKAPTEKGVVKFYQKIYDGKDTYDFYLEKKIISDTNHGFIVVADPQIWAGKEFQQLEFASKDILNTVKSYNNKILFHGIGCGDIVSNDHSYYKEYTKTISKSGLDFYNSMGNHDMTIYGRSTETSQTKYEDTFGPAYYSYNVGNLHYVVLNDNFYIGRDYFYIGYIDEKQLTWLEKDLANIKKGSTLVITIHIPSSCEPKDRKEFKYDKAGVTMTNFKGLYDIVEDFNTHIISGHTHTIFNQQIKPNLYEHVTAALSGAWWQGDLCTDGTPKGYGVYEVNGDSLKWYFKSVGKDSNFQMRLYSGQDYPEFNGYVVSNIWNSDSSWSVELYEDGVSKGGMERFETYDPSAREMYSNKSKLDHKWIYPSLSDHFYRAKPASFDSKIEVVAKDRFGKVYRETLRSKSQAGDSYEVLIVGGGVSGIAAGIQAARMGVSSVIIEEFEWLGGMLTSAGVSAVDGNFKLKGGVWAEFRDSLSLRYGGEKALATGWVSNILFEPSIGNKIFNNIAGKEKNLSVWFNSGVGRITKDGDSWLVEVIKNGKTKIVKAKVIIDATELGDIAKKVGVTYDIGMDSKYLTGEVVAPEVANNIIQDLTYAMILKDYDRDMTIPKPLGYNPTLFYCSTISDKCINPKEKKRLWSKEMMINYGKLPNRKYMINWPIEGNDFYIDMIEMSQSQREEAIKQAKNMSLCFLYYLQTELGFKNLGLADDEFPTKDKFPFIPYHRESRRINGLVQFTFNHITNPYTQKEKLYRTSVGVGDYPVDHHHTRYSGWSELPDLHFLPVPSYGFPLGIMIPKNTRSFIVAEKSVSVTNIVNGSTRLQPVVLQIGQAAGALAALSAIQNKDVKDVSVRDVQREILKAGGYLLPFLDIPADHKHFKAIQKIGATGIIKGVGMNKGWENQTWFKTDSLITEKELSIGLNEVYDNLNVSFQENRNVSLNYLLPIFAQITGEDEEEIYNRLLKDFGALGLKGIKKEIPLSRVECAVIIDRIANPFDNKLVDIYGNNIH